MPNNVIMYTDGACSGNPGPGGGWFINRNLKFAPTFFKERLKRQGDVIPEHPSLTGPIGR